MWTIVIQAGGASLRMGQNKALTPFLGQPLVERVLLRMQGWADELIITTNQPDAFRFLKVRLVPDRDPGIGALGGLLTALWAAQHPLVGVVACDMPFANPALLTAERDLILSEGWDAVIPISPQGLEPLHAVYRRETCLPAIEIALRAGQKRLISWLGDVRVREFGLDEVARYDPTFRSFLNVNTMDELKQAEAQAQISD